MKTANFLPILCAALLLVCGGCSGGNSGRSTEALSAAGSATGKGQVAFTIRWPAATAATSRLIPLAANALKFTVTETDAPNNVVVLTKTAPRPADSETTSTVLLSGLPTVNVSIKVEAFPNADATGNIQASGTVNVTVPQNQTVNQSVTLGTSITKVEVMAAAPITIDANGKFTLNLSDKTNIQAALTATAYDAAHNMVLTALNKWGFVSAKPGVARVAAPTAATNKSAHRAQPINGATALVTAISDGSSVINIVETESQVGTQVAVAVVGGTDLGWNQQLGDAQNSSCSSGPAASGVYAGSFVAKPVGALGDNGFNQVEEFVESPDGNVAFLAGAEYISDSGVLEYSKTGTQEKHLYLPASEPTFGADGTLYTVDSANGYITATGPSAWSFTVGASGSDSSFVTLSGDGGAIYGVFRGTLYALDAHSGAQQWQVSVATTNYTATAKPAVSLDNTTVYSSSSAGISAFDAATGKKLWDAADGSLSDASYVGVGPTGTVYAVGSYGLLALDPATGQKVWGKDNVTTPLVLSRNGTINGTITADTGRVEIALNGVDGSVKWTSPTNVYAVGGAADGTLYGTLSDSRTGFSVNYLVALNSGDGSVKWELTPNLTDTTPSGGSISGYYSLLAVGGDGTVYAFQSPGEIDLIR